MAKYVNDKFKEVPANTPIRFHVIEVSGPIQAESKAGKPYSYKNYTLRDEHGTTYPPCRILKELYASTGDWIVGMIPFGKEYPEWSLDEGIDPSKVPPSPGPSQTRRIADTAKQDAEFADAKATKDIVIHLNGLFQAYVSNPNRVMLNDSVDRIIEEALAFAVKAREAINQKAKEIHHGISLPVQTTKLEDTPWGDDEQAPFPTEQ